MLGPTMLGAFARAFKGTSWEMMGELELPKFVQIRSGTYARPIIKLCVLEGVKSCPPPSLAVGHGKRGGGGGRMFAPYYARDSCVVD